MAKKRSNDPRATTLDGPDPLWAGARQFDERPTTYVDPASAARSEFNPEAAVEQPIPEFLRGSGGGTPQPDPVQVTGVARRMEIDPLELNGSLRTTDIRNRGMPEGGDANKYPEPPPGPQAIQGIPPFLARPPEAQAARAASKPKMAKVVAPGQAQTPSAPVLQDSGRSTTPDFDAFIAQRAKEIADVKRAQGTADQARRWQDIANGFVRAGDVASGRKTDETALQQRLDNTSQPVQNILQQQQVGRQSTQDALAQTSLSGKMFEQRLATQANDPNSAVSQRTQQFLAGTGLFPKGSEKFISAADYEKALQAGAQGIHALTLKANIAHQNAQLEIDRGKAAEDIRNHNMEHEDRQFRMYHDAPTQTQNELDALIGSGRSLRDLIDAHDKAGFGDILGSYMGMGDYNATKKAAGPEVAKGDGRGRVNPTGAERATANLPNFNPGSRKTLVDKFTNNQRDAEAKLREMEANPRVLPETVAEKRRLYNEVFGSAPTGQTARPRRTSNGETREWDGKAWVPING